MMRRFALVAALAYFIAAVAAGSLGLRPRNRRSSSSSSPRSAPPPPG
jgi:hypothetical protein